MPRRPPLVVPKFSRRSFVYLVAVGALLILSLRQGGDRYARRFPRWSPIADDIKDPGHPIDVLVANADHAFAALLHQRVSGLSAAAQAYRARRGRHPPPEFDKWVELAEQNGALLIEEFYDTIYDDLEPFWSIEGKEIRARASTWPNIISIRNHVARINRNVDSAKPKLKGRFEMLKILQARLPDVDLAISTEDQQPIIVPWEEIRSALEVAAEHRPVPLLDPVSVPFTKYLTLAELPRPSKEEQEAWADMWRSSERYWEVGRKACPPRSPARSSHQDDNLKMPPTFLPAKPYKSYHGYVSNWTQSKSPCIHPELRNAHGSLIAPHLGKRHDELFPLFADSKIQDLNNVIVLPARNLGDRDADDLEAQSLGRSETKWEHKKAKMVWRGPANGGDHSRENWKRFHRHRFVAMANSSWVSAVEHKAGEVDAVTEPPLIFPLPANQTWALGAMQTTPSQLGAWIEDLADVGFVHFMCNPGSGFAGLVKPGNCDYVKPYYNLKTVIEMPELSEWKYVADIDGGSSSPRFPKILHSNSVPLKATIFSEWHDKRLVPWKHFVPVDNSFADLWGILEYFFGFSNGSEKHQREAHDTVGEAIGLQGQMWANQVLRHEDMLLYVYRLVLEYARLCDDRRDNMGFVNDLIP